MASLEMLNEFVRYYRDYRNINVELISDWHTKINNFIDDQCKEFNINEDELLVKTICDNIREKYEAIIIREEFDTMCSFFKVDINNENK